MTITFEPPVVAGTPLDDARAQLREATTILGYHDGLYEMLATPRREVTVSIPLRRDNSEIELFLGHRFSTTSPADRPRAACVTRQMSRWTRYVPWRCG